MTRCIGSLSVLLLATLASCIPAARDLVQFLRPEHSSAWRLFSTQLLHPNFEVALADLGILTLAGMWLESRSRRTWCLVLVASLLATAVSVALASSDLRSYQGASGLAAGMLSAALIHAANSQRGVSRALLALAALLPLLKALLEDSGFTWSDAHLPAGVQVFAPAHLAGALAGLLVGVLVLAKHRRNHAR